MQLYKNYFPVAIDLVSLGYIIFALPLSFASHSFSNDTELSSPSDLYELLDQVTLLKRNSQPISDAMEETSG